MSVKIFGFGSYFKRTPRYNDIDILLVHENISEQSCFAALKCKSTIIDNLDSVHVSILSESEEKSVDFLKTSEAIFIGTISESAFDRDMLKIFAIIMSLNLR